jgi:hypothetical protein
VLGALDHLDHVVAGAEAKLFQRELEGHRPGPPKSRPDHFQAHASSLPVPCRRQRRDTNCRLRPRNRGAAATVMGYSPLTE